MFFSASCDTDILTINTNKNSSTLQNKKASDLFINQECSSDRLDIFPDITPYSTMFPSVKIHSRPERTSLSILRKRYSLHCSITIEAAIILPIFLLCIASIMCLFHLLQIENSMQRRLSEVARDAILISSISDEIFFMDAEDEKTLKEDSSSESLLDFKDIAYHTIGVSYVTTTFLDDKTHSIIDNSLICDGIGGISFSGTHFNHSTNVLTIQINYEVGIPFLPFINNLPVKQTCKVKLFTGQAISLNKEAPTHKVYITISGNVYHTSKYCNYLTKYSDVVPKNKAYKLGIGDCSICRHLYTTSEYVYVSETGDVYHYSIDCPVFSRYIYCVNFSDLDSFYTLCERCENLIN